MEGENSKVINGASKGFSPEEANNSSDEELGTPKGSEEGADDTIKNLHHEIESLRRERSNLYLQIDNLKAEIEKSAASAESLVIHATHLEGQLIHTQEDLSAAMATAEDTSNSVKSLEESKAAMESKVAALELERGKQDGEIRALMEEARAWKSKSEEMEKVLDEVRSMNSELEARIEAMLTKKRDMVDAEVKISASKEEEMGKTMMQLREENTELGGTVCEYEATFSKEDVLENTLKKMVDRNTELERKLGELATTVGPSFSWATTTAVAACTGAVSIAMTAIYLRGQS